MILEALHQLWLATHETKYLTYVKSNIDMFIGGDGSIRTYNYKDFNPGNLNTGRQLLFLYSVTRDKKYRIAADTLMLQLKNQSGTKTGGFPDNKIYPFQMRLEDLYMSEPFYAQYSKMFMQTQNFSDIASRLILLKEKTTDWKTGLLFHAWNERRAETETENAPDFCAAAIGSYAMALVDVLDYFPKSHPGRKELIKILRNLSEALLKVRDENSQLWNESIGRVSMNGNNPEASLNCMLAYTFAKGANKGYLKKKYLNFSKETFFRVMREFITAGQTGPTDPQGFGPFLLTAIELEKAKILNKNENYILDKSKITKF